MPPRNNTIINNTNNIHRTVSGTKTAYNTQHSRTKKTNMMANHKSSICCTHFLRPYEYTTAAAAEDKERDAWHLFESVIRRSPPDLQLFAHVRQHRR